MQKILLALPSKHARMWPLIMCIATILVWATIICHWITKLGPAHHNLILNVPWVWLLKPKSSHSALLEGKSVPIMGWKALCPLALATLWPSLPLLFLSLTPPSNAVSLLLLNTHLRSLCSLSSFLCFPRMLFFPDFFLDASLMSFGFLFTSHFCNNAHTDH